MLPTGRGAGWEFCGELAGDADAVPILLGLGVDELSMAPASIPHAKTLVRAWPLAEAKVLARQALTLELAGQVRASVPARGISHA